MKNYLRSIYLLLAVAMGLSCLAAYAQEKAVKRVPARPTTAVGGKELFRQYCAVCHGEDAKGAGPAASALKISPTDLTQISRKNNGKFPEERVLANLKGESGVAAHGTQDMPVWGPIFTNMTPNLNESQNRIYALMNYMEEIQAK
jgi:mono/diheme cytochrome c family protein